MVYSFELLKHANIRYRSSLPLLAQCELYAMLFSLGLSCEIRLESMGGSSFLTFESRELTEEELSYLSGHSSVVFLAEKQGSVLRPLVFPSGLYLPEDLPEVLKYKGKTGVPFTRMMINTAAALSACSGRKSPPTLFDPLCGKGTSCFCAAMAGMNAVGLDLDKKEIREASDYFSRYLKFHMLKHQTESRSETIPGGSLPVTVFQFADSKEHYRAGEFRSLVLACGDTIHSAALFKRSGADLITADLPYGIQHAPRESGAKAQPIIRFLQRSVPEWKKALRPGGVMALSFNTLILSAQSVREILVSNGFTLPKHEMFYGLKHEVEQAVVRDVVFAFNSEEETGI